MVGRASKSFQVVAICSELLLAKLIAVHWVAAVGLVSGDGGVVSMVLFALGVCSMLGSMGVGSASVGCGWSVTRKNSA